jgi:8-oxo-dGTP pyrophosphatase MutT (NUDIX family)
VRYDRWVSVEREAGAIVVRRDGGSVRVLVVTAKRDSTQWLFPKGHIERGETAEAAALREAAEEAGVIGRLVRPAGELSYKFEGRSIHVRYFLVEYEEQRPAGEGRRCVWLPPSGARRRLTFPDTRTVLDRALATLDDA